MNYLFKIIVINLGFLLIFNPVLAQMAAPTYEGNQIPADDQSVSQSAESFFDVFAPVDSSVISPPYFSLEKTFIDLGADKKSGSYKISASPNVVWEVAIEGMAKNALGLSKTGGQGSADINFSIDRNKAPAGWQDLKLNYNWYADYQGQRIVGGDFLTIRFFIELIHPPTETVEPLAPVKEKLKEPAIEERPAGQNLDFGDAPDPNYPSRLNSNGVRHLDISRAWLGDRVDGELDSDQIDEDEFDDGMVSWAPIRFKVTNLDWSGNLYINLLADRNRDGDWSDTNEWIIRNMAINLLPGQSRVYQTNINLASLGFGSAAPEEPPLWIRVTLTDVALTNYRGEGEFRIGETEDYKIFRSTDWFNIKCEPKKRNVIHGQETEFRIVCSGPGCPPPDPVIPRVQGGADKDTFIYDVSPTIFPPLPPGYQISPIAALGANWEFIDGKWQIPLKVRIPNVDGPERIENWRILVRARERGVASVIAECYVAAHHKEVKVGIKEEPKLLIHKIIAPFKKIGEFFRGIFERLRNK